MAATGKAEPQGPQQSGIGMIRTHFHGSLPTQVPAEDLGGRMPHPWGCRERVGSGSGVGGPAGRLTMSGEIQGIPGAVCEVFCVADRLPGCFPNKLHGFIFLLVTLRQSHRDSFFYF